MWSALNSDGSGPCGPAYNCTDSELGHLFYVEGMLTANDSITDSAVLDAAQGGAFTNLQNFVYRPGTEYAPGPGFAWFVRTDLGLQGYAV